MDSILSNPAMVMAIVAGLVIGIVVLVKMPEMFVAVLLVGPTYIQLCLRLFGLDVSRRTFAAAGAFIFVPIVLLFLIMRLSGSRERTPIFGRPNIPFVVCTMVMGLWLLIGLGYTPAPNYGGQKTSEYFVFGMAPMVLAFVFLRDRNAARRFLLWVIALTGLYITLPTAYTFVKYGTLSGIIQGGDPEGLEGAIRANIALGSAIVNLAAAALGLAAGRTKAIWRWLPLLVLPLSVYLVIASGSRSNIVALAAVAVVGFVLAYWRQRAVIVVGSLLLAGAVLLLYEFGSEDIHEKIFSSWVTTETVSGVSGHSRIEMLETCIANSTKSPIMGLGTGAWPIVSFGMDEYDYPHNAFGELLLENGLVGLLLYCTMWIIIARRIWSALRRSEVGTELYGMAVFGACMMAWELANCCSHFGLAHHSNTMLLTSAVVLRVLYLAEEPSGEVEPPIMAGEMAELHARL